ncbi:hypothetical protein CYMTET_19343 [Cymbomonas tetramitiformis]|uniref:Exportin-1/Importin-beta-like domain-containing protein n=1 Tax=Cymbomonas tetramitiformis TaxID=36881 RepID=A0AAE0G685_9CHLO|nr:hypothetical protein CYMTET_19343 [Cymbomonas tetramitiformis]
MSLAQELRGAVYALYNSQDNTERIRADKWLQDFLRGEHAWSVSLELLLAPDATQTETIFCARGVHVILRKCRIEADTKQPHTKFTTWGHTAPSTGQWDEMHQALVQLLWRHGQEPSPALTQLGLALAALLCKMPHLPITTAVPQLIAWLSATAEGAPGAHFPPLALLEVLRVLPEEVSSRELSLSPRRRGELIDHLHTAASTVLPLLEASAARHASGPAAAASPVALAVSLGALASWVEVLVGGTDAPRPSPAVPRLPLLPLLASPLVGVAVTLLARGCEEPLRAAAAGAAKTCLGAAVLDLEARPLLAAHMAALGEGGRAMRPHLTTGAPPEPVEAVCSVLAHLAGEAVRPPEPLPPDVPGGEGIMDTLRTGSNAPRDRVYIPHKKFIKAQKEAKKQAKLLEQQQGGGTGADSLKGQRVQYPVLAQAMVVLVELLPTPGLRAETLLAPWGTLCDELEGAAGEVRAGAAATMGDLAREAVGAVLERLRQVRALGEEDDLEGEKVELAEGLRCAGAVVGVAEGLVPQLAARAGQVAEALRIEVEGGGAGAEGSWVALEEALWCVAAVSRQVGGVGGVGRTDTCPSMAHVLRALEVAAAAAEVRVAPASELAVQAAMGTLGAIAGWLAGQSLETVQRALRCVLQVLRARGARGVAGAAVLLPASVAFMKLATQCAGAVAAAGMAADFCHLFAAMRTSATCAPGTVASSSTVLLRGLVLVAEAPETGYLTACKLLGDLSTLPVAVMHQYSAARQAEKVDPLAVQALVEALREALVLTESTARLTARVAAEGREAGEGAMPPVWHLIQRLWPGLATLLQCDELRGDAPGVLEGIAHILAAAMRATKHVSTRRAESGEPMEVQLPEVVGNLVGVVLEGVLWAYEHTAAARGGCLLEVLEEAVLSCMDAPLQAAATGGDAGHAGTMPTGDRATSAGAAAAYAWTFTCGNGRQALLAASPPALQMLSSVLHSGTVAPLVTPERVMHAVQCVQSCLRGTSGDDAVAALTAAQGLLTWLPRHDARRAGGTPTVPGAADARGAFLMHPGLGKMAAQSLQGPREGVAWSARAEEARAPMEMVLLHLHGAAGILRTLFRAASGSLPPNLVTDVAVVLYRTWILVGDALFHRWMEDALSPVEGGLLEPPGIISDVQGEYMGALLTAETRADVRKFKRALKALRRVD